MIVFENRVLKRTFGPNLKEEGGNWRKWGDCEWYFIPNIIGIFKLNRMLDSHIMYLEENINANGFGWKIWREEAAWKK